MQSTVAPRPGRIALRLGLIFGVILAVLEIVVSLLSGFIGLFSIILVYGLYLVVPIFPGIRAAGRTGRVSTGLLAGLFTGLFASIIASIFTLVYDLVNIDSIRQSAQKLSPNVQITNGILIAGFIIGIVIVLIVGTVLGLAGGSIGGAIGKGRAPVQTQAYQEAMFQPPQNYPPQGTNPPQENYPPQNYPPPPENYPPAQ